VRDGYQLRAVAVVVAVVAIAVAVAALIDGTTVAVTITVTITVAVAVARVVGVVGRGGVVARIAHGKARQLLPPLVADDEAVDRVDQPALRWGKEERDEGSETCREVRANDGQRVPTSWCFSAVVARTMPSVMAARPVVGK